MVTASTPATAASHPWRALLIRTGYVHAAVALAVLIPLTLWLLSEPFPLLPDPWLSLVWVGLFAVQVIGNPPPWIRYAAFAIFVPVTAMEVVPALRAAMESDPGSVPAAVLWTALLIAGVIAGALAVIRLVINRRVGAVLGIAIAVGIGLTGGAGLLTCLVFGFESSVFARGLQSGFMGAVLLIMTVLEGLTATGKASFAGAYAFVASSYTLSVLLRLLSGSAELTL